MVGNPNAGKSTLFNALTGLRQRVANYPGVTVEKRTGTAYTLHGEAVELIDLPGMYSLSPRSPDEEIARKPQARRRQDRLRRGVLPAGQAAGAGRRTSRGQDRPHEVQGLR